MHVVVRRCVRCSGGLASLLQKLHQVMNGILQQNLSQMKYLEMPGTTLNHQNLHPLEMLGQTLSLRSLHQQEMLGQTQNLRILHQQEMHGQMLNLRNLHHLEMLGQTQNLKHQLKYQTNGTLNQTHKPQKVKVVMHGVKLKQYLLLKLINGAMLKLKYQFQMNGMLHQRLKVSQKNQSLLHGMQNQLHNLSKVMNGVRRTHHQNNNLNRIKRMLGQMLNLVLLPVQEVVGVQIQ